ncbi:MAG TPA: hypothetical protein VN813_15725 [Luteibacter sp.]|nr:hypothetical protein [Luteibacter sp.]
MRNTKLIVAMLAGCMAVSGAALAQDASKSPTPASTAGTPTHTTSDSMKKTGTDSESMSQDSMKSNDSMKSDSNDSMKSTHKKHKKSGAEPAKSSTSGM